MSYVQYVSNTQKQGWHHYKSEAKEIQAANKKIRTHKSDHYFGQKINTLLNS